MHQEHVPVLLDAVIEALAVRSDGRYVDATYGRGGHSAAVLDKLGTGGRLLAFDRDPDAVAAARTRFGADPRFDVVQGAFGDLARILTGAGWDVPVDGVLLDVGVSSPQLDDARRGFSFGKDGPLDMRMDPGSGVSAAEWLASVDERALADVIYQYGEERYARRIARAIVDARDGRGRCAAAGPTALTRTAQLADVIRAAGVPHGKGRHPATRTFQAIRVFINSELEQLQQALDQALAVLAPGGRLCVIAFHSLEDRLVKRFIQKHSTPDPVYAGLPVMPAEARPTLRRVGRALTPDESECAANPRARSAHLRVAERLS